MSDLANLGVAVLPCRHCATMPELWLDKGNGGWAILECAYTECAVKPCTFGDGFTVADLWNAEQNTASSPPAKASVPDPNFADFRVVGGKN